MERSIRFGNLSLVLPLLAAAVAFWARSAQATPPLYWDINGSVAGAGGATPSGTWNYGYQYWNLSSDGTGTCIPVENTSYNFFFSAGNDATGDYTITVCGTRYAKSITVEDGTPTFSGEYGVTSKLVLSGTGSINTNARNPLFKVVIGDSLDSVGLLTKTGLGTLTLDAANTYTGLTTVEAGTLKLVGTTTAPKAWNPVLNVGGSDIQGGKMVFDYTGGTTPASTI